MRVFFKFTESIGGLLNQGMTFDEFSRHFQAQLINGKTTGSDNHPLITGKPSGD